MSLKQYITDNLRRTDGKLNSAIIRRESFLNSTQYLEILNLTSFLSTTATISERIWCVDHDIQSIRQCQICSMPAIFLPSINCGYSHTCSSPRCKTLHSMPKRDLTFQTKYGAKVSPLHRQKARERSPNLQVKGRATVMERYGVTNVSKILSVKCKKKETMAQNYGPVHPSCHPHIRSNIILNNRSKYGVDYPQQLPEYKEKKRVLNRIKFNTNSHKQSHCPDAFNKLQDYNWLYEEYIVKQKPAYAIAMELGLSPTQQNSSTVARYLNAHGLPIRRIRKFSYKAISWMDMISAQENIFIQHALDGGEFVIPELGISVDGYCSESNTVYEFHGDLFHGNPSIFSPTEHCHPFDELITADELYQKTMLREQEIRDAGYQLITMWEADFKMNI